jgi:hypothetical protein
MHDCKGFSVGQDLNQTREKIVQLANVVWFNKVILDDDVDLLISDKEGLSNDDLIELDKERREKAGVKGTEEGEIVCNLTNRRLSEAL